jgi:hypothetical protein
MQVPSEEVSLRDSGGLGTTFVEAKSARMRCDNGTRIRVVFA